jgi:hypothetical protein
MAETQTVDLKVAETIPLTIEQGSIAINFRFDIGDGISDFGAVAEKLNVEMTQRQTIKPRKPRLNENPIFIDPPIYAEINCVSFRFGDLSTEQTALLLVYSNGCLEIEFKINLDAQNLSLDSLKKLVHVLSNEVGKLDREARKLANETALRLGSLISESREPSISEDFIAIVLSRLSRQISDQEILSGHAHTLASIIEQEDEVELSRSHVRKVLKNRLSYAKKELLILGFNVGIFIGEDMDDEANLVDIVNLHRLELRLLLKLMADEHESLQKLYSGVLEKHSIGRKSLKQLDRISLRIVDLIARAEKVRNAATDPLPLTVDSFLADVYLKTAEIFGVPKLLKKVELRIEELNQLQEKLVHTKEHQTALGLEKGVFYVIVVEGIPTLLKWIVGLVGLLLGSNWIVNNLGKFAEDFLKIFSH